MSIHMRFDDPSHEASLRSVLPILDVRGLTVEIGTETGTVHAATDISFSVRPGEIVGVIGETGSGKSTMAKAFVGLLPARGKITSGTVRLRQGGREIDILRQDAGSMRRLRGEVVGFIPQSTAGALNPVLTVEGQFRAVLRAHGKFGRAQARVRALEMLDLVGIADPERVVASHAHQLSGGMAQRVVTAITMSLNPHLIIADEPTTGLDVTVQKQVLDRIQNLVMTQGKSMLLVTHDMGIVAQYCSRVVVLYGGYVVEVGPAASVLSRPRHPYTRVLVDAVPQRNRQLRPLSGSVGDLHEIPSGCPFYARCPVRSDQRCENQRPPLTAVGVDHVAATFCDQTVI